MVKSQKVVVPILAWYGDEELELEFPESWDVTVCNMKGYNTPPLSANEIRKAFANPIGTKTVKELAKGKREVAILFDDMTRATPTALLIPYVLEELAAADIPDDNIRFIAAIGAHGSMNGIDFRKKLGDEVMARFLVYNHNPYENCTPLGFTSHGTPVSVNSEFLACDLKIGIGSIVPHPFGFGGGSKIVLPGIASMETIDANHTRLGLSPTVGMAKYEGNVLREDIEETARMVGLDVKVDGILNLKRELTALFVGEPITEHAAGVKLAMEHYATEVVGDADIVVANCYAKASETLLALPVASPLLSQKGGDMVIIAVTPEGQITHYFDRSFGKNLGGRGWRAAGATPRYAGEQTIPSNQTLPPNTKRLTIMTPYSDKVGGDWVAPYHLINWAKTWTDVIQELKRSYGEKAKVAVIPDATMQYFPNAS